MMNLVSNILVFLVAIIHIYIVVLEMYLYQKPLGLKTFRVSPEKAAATAQLMFNQGLYNGFLAAGLIWSLIHPQAEVGFQLKLFFLLCVFAAGLVGGYSVNRRIIFVQSLPSLLAVVAVWFSR